MIIIEMKFPVCDYLFENSSIHCTALVITENLIKNPNGLPSLAQPTHDLRNGTLTFVKTGGKVYGITCWHVIEHFRKQLKLSGNPHSHSMRTMVSGFYAVQDLFIRPSPQYGDPAIDIGIRELNPKFPSEIGKTPIDLDLEDQAPIKIDFGYAVGFPETMKYRKDDDGAGYRVSMPQVQILAEINGFPTRKFTLFSELPTMPEQTDYSGMSGGPIFWSIEDAYGIFGIIYEGGVGSQTSDGKSIYVYGELATPAIIKDWISQIAA